MSFSLKAVILTSWDVVQSGKDRFPIVCIKIMSLQSASTKGFWTHIFCPIRQEVHMENSIS